MISRYLVATTCMFILSACTSGGGDTTTQRGPVNTPPSVDAGADQTIRLPVDTATLDGTATDTTIPSGGALSVAWTVQSGPAGATFADANSVDTTVTFVSEGVYVLELTADDTQASSSDTVTVTVEAAPALASIAVTPSDVSLVAGGTQAFSAAGTDQYGDAITPSVTWSATGGTIDPAGNYTAGTVTGTFEVTATDGTISDTANVTITDSPPTANAGGPYNGVEGAPVSLDGSGSTDPNNDIVAYDWDLDGDGDYSDASGATATFAAASAGVYDIGLRVTDGGGATDADTTTVTIANVAPTANAGGPYSGDQGADITVDGSGSSDPGGIVSYEWDLDNDGAYDDAAGTTATFNSATTGTFTIGLRVSDASGATSTATATVTVGNVAPTADAGGPYSGDQGADIAVSGAASSDSGGIVSYEWDLDNDGAYDDATGVDATFNSAAPGTFTIGLQVTDGDGASDTATTTVEVADLAPVADAGGPYAGDQDEDISLDASGSSDPSGIASYEWDLDDDGAFDDATGVNTIFSSANFGDFTVGLRVTDNDGSSARTTVTVTVIDSAPSAPVGLSASGEDGQVVLDWADNPEPDLDGYVVHRSETQGGPYTTIPPLLVASGFTDDTVVNGTTYYYVVTARDGGTNESANSTEVSVTPNGAMDAFWTMDEGVGASIADTVLPDDGSGSISGASWVGGITGTALDFDGSNDHVVIDNTSTLKITGKTISMHAWLFPRSGGASGGSRIISKRTDGGGQDVYAMILNEYRMRFRLDGQDLTSSHIVVLNEWVHVAMVYDGVDMRIYINGVLDAATPLAKTDPIDASSRAVHLGMREGEARYYEGVMDDVRISNQVIVPGIVVPPPRGAGLFFEDITVPAGTSGPADGGHGVMFAEVDGDSLPDYYLTNNLEFSGDRPDFYFDNANGATFSENAAALGIDDEDGGSHGAVWADLDNDGDYDLVNGTTWDNANPSRGNPDFDNVFENRLDEVTADFDEVTPASVQAVEIETRGITAFDMDADGDLDLFGIPSAASPVGNAAFLNDGGFAFSAHVGGILSTAVAHQGVSDTDFDGDGDVDVLAANRVGDFAILENDGNGVFTQILPSTIGITDPARDGVTTADVDNDGDLDMLLVSDGRGELWLRNEPGGTYTKQQTFRRIEGYMGGFADLDNDGDQDLVFAGDEHVFLNDGNGNFTSGQSVPVSEIGDPRAIAFADIEGDGDLDFAIAAKDSRSWLVRNDFDSGNWLRVELVSPQCQAGAFGAKVSVFRTVGDGGAFVGMREARGNHGYLAQDEPVLHFGLGSIGAVDVVVDFLDGTQSTVLNVAANQRILVDECP